MESLDRFAEEALAVLVIGYSSVFVFDPEFFEAGEPVRFPEFIVFDAEVEEKFVVFSVTRGV